MDFDLSEEQRLLKESLERLTSDRYAFEQRKNYAQNAEGWSRELWAQYAELGLLGLPFPEQHPYRAAFRSFWTERSLGQSE